MNFEHQMKQNVTEANGLWVFVFVSPALVLIRAQTNTFDVKNKTARYRITRFLLCYMKYRFTRFLQNTQEGKLESFEFSPISLSKNKLSKLIIFLQLYQTEKKTIVVFRRRSKLSVFALSRRINCNKKKKHKSNKSFIYIYFDKFQEFFGKIWQNFADFSPIHNSSAGQAWKNLV